MCPRRRSPTLPPGRARTYRQTNVDVQTQTNVYIHTVLSQHTAHRVPRRSTVHAQGAQPPGRTSSPFPIRFYPRARIRTCSCTPPTPPLCTRAALHAAPLCTPPLPPLWPCAQQPTRHAYTSSVLASISLSFNARIPGRLRTTMIATSHMLARMKRKAGAIIAMAMPLVVKIQ